MSRRRPAVLLTGFGPFPGVPENASSLLVPELAAVASRRWPGIKFEAVVLPTEWLAGPAAVSEILDCLKPTLALHFGVASTARGFTIESRGHNRTKQLSDAAGRLPPSERLSPDGPDSLAATIPVARIVARLRRRSLPVKLSRDAGGYLCNAVLYGSLRRARQADWRMRSGFVHLPASLGGVAVSPRSATRLDWSQALEGSLEIIAETVGRL